MGIPCIQHNHCKAASDQKTNYSTRPTSEFPTPSTMRLQAFSKGKTVIKRNHFASLKKQNFTDNEANEPKKRS